MAFDFTDFYIEYPGHPRFNDAQIIEDDLVRVVVQKWEMVIFTNRGELFCEPDFGGDLTKFLHETRLSAETIESELRSQVRRYIPELESITYELQVNFYEDPERYQEYMEILFQIADYNVFAVIT
jgi:phage baseplate assembly protein W